MFLPTYRQSKSGFITDDGQETANTLAMTDEELNRLKSWLEINQIRLLVKPHPMSVHYGQDLKLNGWLWIISDEWLHKQSVTLYEALGQMDALITDTSSVYVDYLVLRRPVFFYFPDLAAYRQTRKFLLEPVEEWLAGPLCRSTEDLLTVLKDFQAGKDQYIGSREKLAGILNPQTESAATGKLFTLIQNTLSGTQETVLTELGVKTGL